MIGSLDQHQLARLWKRVHQSLQLCPRAELIARAADEKLGLGTRLEKRKIVSSLVDRGHWDAEADEGPDARIRAGNRQTDGSAEGKSGKDQRQAELAIQPVERSADIIPFPASVVVLALAQTGTTKIEAQHGESKAVQRLHGVEHDLVVESSSEQRMGMAHQGSVGGSLGASVEQGFQAPCGTVEKQRLDRVLGQHAI